MNSSPPVSLSADLSPSKTGGGRLLALDNYRCLAVSLALLSHAGARFSPLAGERSETAVIFKMITRTALPSLLILFGVMLMIVYYRKFLESPREVTERVLFRAILCYLAFVGLALVAYFTGENSIRHFVAAFGLLVPSENANIFKFYFVILLVAVPFFALRLRFGVSAVPLVTLGLFAVASLASAGLPAAPRPLGHFVGFFSGVGNVWGPSIAHSLVFVAFGMAYAAVFSRSRRAADFAWVGAFGLMACLILAREIHHVGFEAWGRGVAGYDVYRGSNHPVYYAYGIFGAFIMTGVGYLGVAVMPGILQRMACLVGAHTFSFFFIGNFLLLLFPERSHPLTQVVLLCVGVFGASFALTWLWVARLRDLPPCEAFFGGAKRLASWSAPWLLRALGSPVSAGGLPENRLGGVEAAHAVDPAARRR